MGVPFNTDRRWSGAGRSVHPGTNQRRRTVNGDLDLKTMTAHRTNSGDADLMLPSCRLSSLQRNGGHLLFAHHYLLQNDYLLVRLGTSLFGGLLVAVKIIDSGGLTVLNSV